MTKFVKVKPELLDTIEERRLLGDTPESVATSLGLPLLYVQNLFKNKEKRQEKNRARKRVAVTKLAIQSGLRNAVHFPHNRRSTKEAQAYLAVESVMIPEIKAGTLTLIQAQQHLAGLFRGIFDNYAKQPAKRSSSVESGAKTRGVPHEASH
jgi:hypothetical protein